MAYEKECDQILAKFYELRANPQTFGNVHYILVYDGIEFEIIEIAIARLLDDGFVKQIGKEDLKISSEGVAFLFTDTYVDRKERWDLEKNTKEQQYKLNIIELFLKKKTFWIALGGLLIALYAAIVSTMAFYNRNHNACDNGAGNKNIQSNIGNPLINR